MLRALEARNLQWGTDLRLSTEALRGFGPLEVRSATFTVSAGEPLEDVEGRAQRAGLSLGALSPGARGLRVGDFLEGPYAGLRGVLNGRLESTCLALTALLADGTVYRSRPSPRSAAGPDLDGLFLGAGRRAGVLLSATLRLLPLAQESSAVTYSFEDSAHLLRFAVNALQAGCALTGATLWRAGGRWVLALTFAGTAGAVARDLGTLAIGLKREGGAALTGEAATASGAPGPEDERELRWTDACAEVDAGRTVQLYRLAVDSVIARGAVSRGVSLSGPSTAPVSSLWSAIFAAAAPGRVPKGAP